MKSDTQLRQDILDQLEWETSVDASEIGVTVKEGVVTLTGYASCYPDRTEAERITISIAGVRGLANEIEVRLLGPHERSDTDIAGAALRTLQWNVVVPRDRVKVMVRNGWITLEGDVDGQYQRDAAFYAVRNLLGVKGVSNMIILKPKPTPMDVRVKIEAAFRRSAEVDARIYALRHETVPSC